MTAIIKITDGTTATDGTANEVNFIADETGFHLDNWQRTLATWKGGGVWRDPVLGEGRQLQFAKYGNVFETLTLKANSTSQDNMIADEQNLIRLLNQATDYWLRDDITVNPVYLEVKATNETNTRYALIYDFRIPSIGGQFSQPYLQPGCLSALDDFDLIIERGQWLALAPGTDEGVSVSSIQYLQGDVSGSPAANSDTAYYYVDSSGVGTISTTSVWIGDSDNYNGAIRFTNMAIPQGVTILNAYMTLYIDSSSGFSNQFTCYIDLYGEDTDDAATFSTYADIVARDRTTTSIFWEAPASYGLTSILSINIAEIIQEIIDRPGWASGNDLVIFFQTDSNAYTNSMELYSYSDGAPFHILTVQYQDESTSYGRTATTNNEVYISNKYSTVNITHVFLYNNSGASFSSNLIGAALPASIYPAVTGTRTDDKLYIGVSDDSGAVEGPFFSTIFDIGSPLLADSSISQVQYSNGSGLTSLGKVRNNTGGNVSLGSGQIFTESGVGSLHNYGVTNFAKITINGVSAYWIVIDATSTGIVNGTQLATQANRDIYTSNRNFIDISSDQLAGDIRPLLRGVFENQNGTPEKLTGGDVYFTNRFIFGARELLTNDYFTSFMNCSNFQNGSGVIVTVGAQTTEGDTDPTTSNGERSTFTATGTTNATRITWDIADFAAQSYYGTFRVFFRGYQATKAGSTFAKVNIQVETGSGGVTFTGKQVAFEYTNDWQLLDLGTIRIPTSSLFTSAEISDTITLNLQIQAGTSGDVVRCYDICLIPTYDYAGDFIDKANTDASRIGFRRYIEIDSTTQPKSDIRAVVANTETDKITGVLQTIASNKFTLEPRANLRLYFLFARYGANDEWVSEPWICHSVQLFKNQRYITARGTD